MSELQLQVRTNPKVAIVMATYNPDPVFLKKQLDSIKNQTYKNFKIYTYDDCSESEKYALIQSMTSDLDSFSLTRGKENLGSFSAFEAALKEIETDCDLIAFCDQDDIWLNNKIENMVHHIYEKNVILVHSDQALIDAKDRIIATSRWSLENRSGQLQTVENFLFHNQVTGCSSLFKVELLKLAMPFPTRTTKIKSYHHDWWIAMCAASVGHVHRVETPLIQYRQHGGNVVGVQTQFELKSPHVLVQRSVSAFNERVTLRKNLIERLRSGISSELSNSISKRLSYLESFSGIFLFLLRSYGLTLYSLKIALMLMVGKLFSHNPDSEPNIDSGKIRMRVLLTKTKSKLKFKDIFWPSLNVLVKVFNIGAINKILVTLLGPVLYGSFGNYINVFQILFSPSSTALSNFTLSVSKTEHKGRIDETTSHFFWLTVLINFLILIGFILLFPVWQFLNISISVTWMAVLLLACVLQPLFALVSAVLNGSRDISRFVKFSMLYGVTSLCLSFFLTYEFGITGAYYSLLTNGLAVLIISFFGFFGIDAKILLKKIYINTSKQKYFKFLTMAIAGSIINPITLIIIRKIIGHNMDELSLGYWQGLQRVSELYLSVVISFISIIYLPELATANSKHELKQAFYRGLGTFFPIGLFSIGFASIFSEFVLTILLTKEFAVHSSSASLFFASDFFRLFSYFLVYLFIARAQILSYVAAEVAFSLIKIGMYYYFSINGNLDSLALAQFISGFFYIIVCSILFYLFKDKIIHTEK